MKREAEEVQEGLINNKVFRWGLFISLGMIFAGLIQVSCSRSADQNENKKRPAAIKSVKRKVSRPIICKDAEKINLTEWIGEVRQKTHSKCWSGLVFLPDLPSDKIAIDAPGEINICLWNNDRCVAVIHTSNRNYQEKERSEIPPYSAIRLRGTEGIATIKILENRN